MIDDVQGDRLYHATFQPYLASIQEHGIGGLAGKRNYSDSEAGIVYLATSPEVARSYAEESEDIPDEYLDLIVVLSVPVQALDRNLLGLDANVRLDELDDEPATRSYRGVIRTFEVMEPPLAPSLR